MRRLAERWFGIVIDYDGPVGSWGFLWRLEMTVLPVVLLPVFVPYGLLVWWLS